MIKLITDAYHIYDEDMNLLGVAGSRDAKNFLTIHGNTGYVRPNLIKQPIMPEELYFTTLEDTTPTIVFIEDEERSTDKELFYKTHWFMPVTVARILTTKKLIEANKLKQMEKKINLDYLYFGDELVGIADTTPKEDGSIDYYLLTHAGVKLVTTIPEDVVSIPIKREELILVQPDRSTLLYIAPKKAYIDSCAFDGRPYKTLDSYEAVASLNPGLEPTCVHYQGCVITTSKLADRLTKVEFSRDQEEAKSLKASGICYVLEVDRTVLGVADYRSYCQVVTDGSVDTIGRCQVLSPIPLQALRPAGPEDICNVTISRLRLPDGYVKYQVNEPFSSIEEALSTGEALYATNVIKTASDMYYTLPRPRGVKELTFEEYVTLSIERGEQEAKTEEDKNMKTSVTKACYIYNKKDKLLGVADSEDSKTFLSLKGFTYLVTPEHIKKPINPEELKYQSWQMDTMSIIAFFYDKRQSTEQEQVYTPQMIVPDSGTQILTTETLVEANWLKWVNAETNLVYLYLNEEFIGLGYISPEDNNKSYFYILTPLEVEVVSTLPEGVISIPIRREELILKRPDVTTRLWIAPELDGLITSEELAEVYRSRDSYRVAMDLNPLFEQTCKYLEGNVVTTLTLIDSLNTIYSVLNYEQEKKAYDASGLYYVLDEERVVLGATCGNTRDYVALDGSMQKTSPTDILRPIPMDSLRLVDTDDLNNLTIDRTVMADDTVEYFVNQPCFTEKDSNLEVGTLYTTYIISVASYAGNKLRLSEHDRSDDINPAYYVEVFPAKKKPTRDEVSTSDLEDDTTEDDEGCADFDSLVYDEHGIRIGIANKDATHYVSLCRGILPIEECYTLTSYKLHHAKYSLKFGETQWPMFSIKEIERVQLAPDYTYQRIITSVYEVRITEEALKKYKEELHPSCKPSSVEPNYTAIPYIQI